VQLCDWVTAKRRPATSTVPVRGGPVAAATSKFTVPFPVPVDPDPMVTQLESDAAVQVQLALEARTVIVPEPPDGAKLAKDSASCITQSAAACVTFAR
jgi:hypothetical protein